MLSNAKGPSKEPYGINFTLCLEDNNFLYSVLTQAFCNDEAKLSFRINDEIIEGALTLERT